MVKEGVNEGDEDGIGIDVGGMKDIVGLGEAGTVEILWMGEAGIRDEVIVGDALGIVVGDGIDDALMCEEGARDVVGEGIEVELGLVGGENVAVGMIEEETDELAIGEGTIDVEEERLANGIGLEVIPPRADGDNPPVDVTGFTNKTR